MQTQYITLPKQAKDIRDQRFGRLVIIEPIHRAAKKGILWSCQCDCGNVVQLFTASLCSGGTKSCGCLHKEIVAQQFTTHGLGKRHPWGTYCNIITRCTNPNGQQYKNYGGRGIKIFYEWLHDYKAFYDYVTQLPHFGEKGYTLDRINNDGNYEPSNLRWATRIQQGQNRRSLHMITFDGKTQCVAAWQHEMNWPRGLIYKRLRRGWSIEKALTTPIL